MYAANMCGKCRRQMLVANVSGFPKYMRQMLAARLRGFVKLLRQIIYDRNKADVEISWNLKIYAPKLCVHQKIGAQTLRLLTIWARQNLQLLTSSKSGWRALVQVMLPLVHIVLKWSEHSGRPAYMGGISPVLYRLLYRHDYLRSVQISAGAYIFTISWGKIKNLSRLTSVLSLHLKFVHHHKSCPNSAATLLSP